jgi:hypothetical protein
VANKEPIFSFKIPDTARAAFAPLVKNKLLATERRIVPAMKQAMLNFMEDVVTDTLNTTQLTHKTGSLAKSLYQGIKVRGTSLSNLEGIYRGEHYARIHEYGGTIRPTNAEVLTLPLPAALRPDGTPKLKGPRSWKRFGTFSYTSKKNGQGYLAYKNKSGKLVLLYIYVDLVRIKPKLGLRKMHTASLGGLLNVWGEIIVNEMVNLDLMAIVDNPDRPAVYRNGKTAIVKKFRPKISLMRKGRR